MNFLYFHLGIGDWGLGIGDWGLGPIPNPQSPIPNPQSPQILIIIHINIYFNKKLIIIVDSLILNNIKQINIKVVFIFS